jgi:hypothetical protein
MSRAHGRARRVAGTTNGMRPSQNAARSCEEQPHIASSRPLLATCNRIGQLLLRDRKRASAEDASIATIELSRRCGRLDLPDLHGSGRLESPTPRLALRVRYYGRNYAHLSFTPSARATDSDQIRLELRRRDRPDEPDRRNRSLSRPVQADALWPSTRLLVAAFGGPADAGCAAALGDEQQSEGGVPRGRFSDDAVVWPPVRGLLLRGRRACSR